MDCETGAASIRNSVAPTRDSCPLVGHQTRQNESLIRIWGRQTPWEASRWERGPIRSRTPLRVESGSVRFSSHSTCSSELICTIAQCACRPLRPAAHCRPRLASKLLCRPVHQTLGEHLRNPRREGVVGRVRVIPASIAAAGSVAGHQPGGEGRVGRKEKPKNESRRGHGDYGKDCRSDLNSRLGSDSCGCRWAGAPKGSVRCVGSRCSARISTDRTSIWEMPLGSPV